jgi:hypothetical protein
MQERRPSRRAIANGKMAFVEPVVRPREGDGPAAVLLQKLRIGVGGR